MNLNKSKKLLIGSCFAICTLCVGMEGVCKTPPSYMCQECWESYIGTWSDLKNIDKEIVNAHGKMSERVELAAEKDITTTVKKGNVAIFALSVKFSEGQFFLFQLPYVVASCSVDLLKTFSAYYWQRNGSYTPVISINDFFRNKCLYNVSVVEKTKAFVEQIVNILLKKPCECTLKEKEEKEETSWSLEEALGLLDKRVESGKYLDHLIDPVGMESGEANDILRSVLHCEQVVLDRIMNDDDFLNLFLSQLKNIKKKDQITGLNFHIDTYRDMCPKCFLIFKYRKDELKNRICEGLKNCGYSNISKNLKFSLFISSHTAYKIPKTKYETGKSVNNQKVDTEQIFQFRNEDVKNEIDCIEKKKNDKCEKIDGLFKQISEEIGVKLKFDYIYAPEKKYIEQIKRVERINKQKANAEINGKLTVIKQYLNELSKITYFPFPELSKEGK